MHTIQTSRGCGLTQKARDRGASLLRASRVSCAWLVCVLVAGCSPLFSTDIKEMAARMATSDATFYLHAQGGAGGLAVGPGAIAPSGGYGSVTIYRSNEPGSALSVESDGSVVIKHGDGIGADLKERVEALEAALKYLLQAISESMKGASGSNRSNVRAVPAIGTLEPGEARETLELEGAR